MTVSINLANLLERLKTTFENETHYHPTPIKEKELDAAKLTADDIKALKDFLKQPRKRLFLFTIHGDEALTETLHLLARQAILQQTAETHLKSDVSGPKVNPLKLALTDPEITVSVGIQIQKSFLVKKSKAKAEKALVDSIKVDNEDNINLVDIDLANFPLLTAQLAALGINQIHDSAQEMIKAHPNAFTDGVVPKNLPKGFYIDKNTNALCFTKNPVRLPSALAPVLNARFIPTNISKTQARVLVPQAITDDVLDKLLKANIEEQKTGLLNVMSSNSKEINNFLNLVSADDKKFIVPLLAKYYLLGGEQHTLLFTRLLSNCLSKKISLEFLKQPEAAEAFLSPRGIKNLQKLLQLPAEQKEWWNTLVQAHLKNQAHLEEKDQGFDFNAFFEAYTQIFIPQITEKNLTLPNPCPIKHEGHLLVTLNRVLEVLERAENPQEQCLNLMNLNWGPTGVHLAMTDTNAGFKQVAACMKLENAQDSQALKTPEEVLAEMDTVDLDLWIYRFIGQHWKKEIRLSHIDTELAIITNQPWTDTEKKQLRFIVANTFANPSSISVESRLNSLKNMIELVNSHMKKPEAPAAADRTAAADAPEPTAPVQFEGLTELQRAEFVKTLAQSFRFVPQPSIVQLNTLIDTCFKMQRQFPAQDFQTGIVEPMVSLLENEGYALLSVLQDRIQKVNPNPDSPVPELTALHSFTNIAHHNRATSSPDLIKVLAALNEPDLKQESVDQLNQALTVFGNKYGDPFKKSLLAVLSQINISKSQTLPTTANVLALIEKLNTNNIKPPTDNPEAWLKDYIINSNILPGCVLGSGDISELGDLIVDALSETIKKRSALLDIDALQVILKDKLQYVPSGLRDQLDKTLMPVLDALNQLVKLLQSDNPQFDQVISKLKYFEENKHLLFENDYALGFGQHTTGDFLLSLILTGKAKPEDKMTSGILKNVLISQVYTVIVKQLHEFFTNEHTKLTVKDADADTVLNWLTAFSETHSLSFIFKDELVQRKVLPAIRKTLMQLNTQDPVFEKAMLDDAAFLNDNIPGDKSLTDYRTRIQGISDYLNILIDIKKKFPTEFSVVYKQLQTDALKRLDNRQKQVLAKQLLEANLDIKSIKLYLNLTSQTLENNPNAQPQDIDRALKSLPAFFSLDDLEEATRAMFFKMSFAHNLKSESPFPLADLNELKKLNLPENIKGALIKSVIGILSRINASSSPEIISSLVKNTKTFLTKNPELGPLCIALLNRLPKRKDQPLKSDSDEDEAQLKKAEEEQYQQKLEKDLNTYGQILNQLSTAKDPVLPKLATILKGMAQNKKDSTADLHTLFNVCEGVGREDRVNKGYVEKVLDLFGTPPYPIAQALNATLPFNDSAKLEAYCKDFDTNPFMKTNEARPLKNHFATHRIKDALTHLKDLLTNDEMPHALQQELARKLTYIETLGYTDPLHPDDYSVLKKLTKATRSELKKEATRLLTDFREGKIVDPKQKELAQLHLIAYLREIYFRSTGLFPNTTQILVLLMAMHSPNTNILKKISTGEGKSLNTPMLSVLQWGMGGTVDVCTANKTLLSRDYTNNAEPFFNFLGIESALIESTTPTSEYKLNGINYSTLEDMSLFRLTAKKAKLTKLVDNGQPVHLVLDESDDALLDQTTLYKLVAEAEAGEEQTNHAAWIYPLAYEFVNDPKFRNCDESKGPVWDEEKDLEEFRLFLNKQINDQFQGDAEKQNYLLASSNTLLRKWLQASIKAEKLVENKHFVIQSVKEKDEAGNETIKKIVCVPLVHSTPKIGCIFTNGVQQALQARFKANSEKQAHLFHIDTDPTVLASQSARGLIEFYKKSKGRLVGISGTPGDKNELSYLNSSLGTQAVGFAPYAGDRRVRHEPIFVRNRKEMVESMQKTIDAVRRQYVEAEIRFDETPATDEERLKLFKEAEEKRNKGQTCPFLIVCEDINEAQEMAKQFDKYAKLKIKVQVITGQTTPEELEQMVIEGGKTNTITIGTAQLARGIDINPGNHPEGLFVIQAYPDSERMSTQIGGRASRNGKPGQYLPIYQVGEPKSFLDKIIYYLFPRWYRRRCLDKIEGIQEGIKLQASVDRLYTQAVDQTQQTLMQQIEGWESLLTELFPEDEKLQSDLYVWADEILNDLGQLEEANITQDNLESSISLYKNAVNKLWEDKKEGKWLAKAASAIDLTPDQKLKLKHLTQIKLQAEFDIQASLQQKNQEFVEGSQTLRHENIDTIVKDKAGTVLLYDQTADQNTKEELQLAKCRQLLPDVIGVLCENYLPAVQVLLKKDPKKPSATPEVDQLLTRIEAAVRRELGKPSILPDVLNKKLAPQEHQRTIQILVEEYQRALATADLKTVKGILDLMKQPMLEFYAQLEKKSLPKRFKMQGLMLNYYDLYEAASTAEEVKDDRIIKLQEKFGKEIIKQLAQYLTAEFGWAKTDPLPFHAHLENGRALEAAREIHTLAGAIDSCPADAPVIADRIKNLYQGLQNWHVVLRDVSLFSVGHSSPRDVITTALSAFDSLCNLEHCNGAFQKKCHDTAVVAHVLTQFNIFLDEISQSRSLMDDEVWKFLKVKLEGISKKQGFNKIHLIHELDETINRFKTYKEYKPYKSKLNALKNLLGDGLKRLDDVDGLSQDYQDSLYEEKEKEIAELLSLGHEDGAVRIRNSSDGIQSFIEVQIETKGDKVKDKAVDGFSGYKSTFFGDIATEKAEVEQQEKVVNDNTEALVQLQSPALIAQLPTRYQQTFKDLFALKDLAAAEWDANPDAALIDKLPPSLKQLVEYRNQLLAWNWKEAAIDDAKLGPMLEIAKNHPALFAKTLQDYKATAEALAEIRTQQDTLRAEVTALEKNIADQKKQHDKVKAQKEHKDTGLLKKPGLMTQIGKIGTAIEKLEAELTNKQKELNRTREPEIECMKRLDAIRKQFAESFTQHAKQSISTHVFATSKATVDKMKGEFANRKKTAQTIEEQEKKKSSYQTKRFFTPTELLQFQARLAEEKKGVEKAQAEKDEKLKPPKK